MRKDLGASRGKPVLVALHEPIYPPTFVDAPRLREMIRPHSNVIAVLQGHLHAEMDWKADGRSYLVAPTLGASATPRFRFVRACPSHLSLRTLVLRPGQERFEMGERERRIEIPPALREGLNKPSGGFEKGNLSCVPAHPCVEDSALAGRRGELKEILRDFLIGGGKPPPEEKGKR